jgi:hypothetical protein
MTPGHHHSIDPVTGWFPTHATMQQAHRVTARIEGKEITIETGKLAKQADGAVVVLSPAIRPATRSIFSR